MTQVEFDSLKKAAEGGDGNAQNELARHYWFGKDVEKDSDKAIELWSKAWENGEPLGAYNLGMAYYTDKGANKDFAKAIEWWTKAAERLARAKFSVVTEKDAFEQLALDLAYYKGDGVPKDKAKAVEIWAKVDAFWPKAFLSKWKRR